MLYAASAVLGIQIMFFFCSLKACSFWLLPGCKNRARRQWQFWPGLASSCTLFTQPPMRLKAGWHLVTLSTMHVRQLLLLSRLMMMLSLKPCLNLMERMKRLFSRTHAQSSSRVVLHRWPLCGSGEAGLLCQIVSGSVFNVSIWGPGGCNLRPRKVRRYACNARVKGSEEIQRSARRVSTSGVRSSYKSQRSGVARVTPDLRICNLRPPKVRMLTMISYKGRALRV